MYHDITLFSKWNQVNVVLDTEKAGIILKVVRCAEINVACIQVSGCNILSVRRTVWSWDHWSYSNAAFFFHTGARMCEWRYLVDGLNGCIHTREGTYQLHSLPSWPQFVGEISRVITVIPVLKLHVWGYKICGYADLICSHHLTPSYWRKLWSFSFVLSTHYEVCLLVPFDFGELNVLGDLVGSVSPSPSPWHEWLSFLLSSLPNVDDLHASIQHGHVRAWMSLFTITSNLSPKSCEKKGHDAACSFKGSRDTSAKAFGFKLYDVVMTKILSLGPVIFRGTQYGRSARDRSIPRQRPPFATCNLVSTSTTTSQNQPAL